MNPWRPLCTSLTYPLWDLWDGTGRLREARALDASQWWEPERLRALQLERLQRIVDYAWRQCAFYRQHWGVQPRIESIEDLRALPLVRKNDVATRLDDLIAAPYRRDTLINAKTGGSTGVSLQLYFDEDCQKKRNAAAMRTDRWAGWRPGYLVGGLWGTPPIPRTLKEHIRNTFHDRTFYLDTMRLDETSMNQFIAEMRRRRPEVLFGHAHSLYVLAQYIADSNLEVPAVRGIIATSMMLIDAERRVINRVFRTEATNRYGCEEVGLIASECEAHSGMHLNSEHVLVEFLRADGTAASDGEEGDIVLTDFSNHGMPLIRYVVGDVGVPSARRCSCGRGLPMLEHLTGRTADFLKRRDGSRVAGISLVEKSLTAIKGIAQLQIVQESFERITLNVVPGEGYGAQAAAELVAVFKREFGDDVAIEVSVMRQLVQERNSKYRFSICRI